MLPVARSELSVIASDIDFCKAVTLFGGHIEIGIVHAKRCEYLVFQEVTKTLFAYNFNYRTENIGADTVVPAGAGLCEQRYFTHFVAHLNG